MNSKALYTSCLILSLSACGTDNVTVEPVDTVSSGRAVAMADAVLSETRKSILRAAYEALQADGTSLVEPNEDLVFASDATFARLDISAAGDSTTTILVPTGTERQANDPNLVAQFYVELRVSTTGPTKTFGPFNLHGVAGSHCGGIAGLRCNEGLSCSFEEHTPDAMGICSAE